MNRRIFTSLVAGVLLSATAAFAQTSTWTIDKNHTEVNFQIRHAAVSTVRGSISNVTGAVIWDEKDLSKASVSATIDTTTVSTNNEARDKHLKSPDFFNVEKFPTMTFQIDLGIACGRQAKSSRRPDSGGCDQAGDT